MSRKEQRTGKGLAPDNLDINRIINHRISREEVPQVGYGNLRVSFD